MSGKARAQPGPLHSSAAAFEARHEVQATADIDDFTRRCGRRAPADKRPCMDMYGHDGPHAWERAADAQQ
jgi:hypothetical protein